MQLPRNKKKKTQIFPKIQTICSKKIKGEKAGIISKKSQVPFDTNTTKKDGRIVDIRRVSMLDITSLGVM